MWLPLKILFCKYALCYFSVVQTISAQTSFIDIRDQKFEGEDKQIVKNLAERKNKSGLLVPQLPLRNLTIRIPHEEKTALRNKEAERDPTEKHLNMKTINVMQQIIYGTQYRLKDFESLLNKYSQDLRFLLSFVFNRLNTLQFEMEVILTVTYKYRDKLKVFQHLVYHEHLLQKYVDIIYVVEYLITLHTDYMKERQGQQQI
ncbi:uncharacterized protein LOC116412908 [Galleria mellonella]|uniref:Uncharacterized protein LOC116412908 n=1 Tax=Galleria mellonella TaxID=7137 RepID=A0A6J3BTS2_GALME|nr:uncharacterized protein LOC116412908 [Galleria mellonella]